MVKHQLFIQDNEGLWVWAVSRRVVEMEVASKLAQMEMETWGKGTLLSLIVSSCISMRFLIHGAVTVFVSYACRPGGGSVQREFGVAGSFQGRAKQEYGREDGEISACEVGESDASKEEGL